MAAVFRNSSGGLEFPTGLCRGRLRSALHELELVSKTESLASLPLPLCHAGPVCPICPRPPPPPVLSGSAPSTVFLRRPQQLYVLLMPWKPQKLQRFSRLAPTPVSSCLKVQGSRDSRASTSGGWICNTQQQQESFMCMRLCECMRVRMQTGFGKQREVSIIWEKNTVSELLCTCPPGYEGARERGLILSHLWASVCEAVRWYRII